MSNSSPTLARALVDTLIARSITDDGEIVSIPHTPELEIALLAACDDWSEDYRDFTGSDRAILHRYIGRTPDGTWEVHLEQSV